jgi:L-lactate dehydrogenase complex protein LldG
MTSKQEILSQIRQHVIPPAALPDLHRNWISYPDKPRQFAELVQSVGGRCVLVPDLAAAQVDLAALEISKKAKKVFSSVPGVGPGNVDLNGVEDPHSLEDLDLAILFGEFAVAENGAIWVTDCNLKQRVVYFITQHLVLVVPQDQILDNMHQAYQRLSFEQPGFGVFISGPSKTADIEQSLVIGAHGPRSLTVYITTNATQSS